MKHSLITLLLLLLSQMGWSQQEKVIISENKKGKRIVLMAENKTTDALNVFLMVFAEGYRRSADKPILKDLPPLSKFL